MTREQPDTSLERPALVGPVDRNDRRPHVRLLSDLCRSLTATGVGVQMRDAIPSLTVNADRAAPPGVGVYVLVSTSGTNFIWGPAENRHPVSDVEGAARRIADFVRQRDRQPSGKPGAGSFPGTPLNEEDPGRETAS